MPNTTTTRFPHEMLTTSPVVEPWIELGRIGALRAVLFGRKLLEACSDTLALAIERLDTWKSRLEPLPGDEAPRRR